MFRYSSVVFAVLLSSVSASAGVLHDFNMIALGNVTGRSHVDGRSLVFGDITGGAKDFAQHNLADSGPVSPGATYGKHGLVVGGRVLTDIKVNHGEALIGGAKGSRIDNAKSTYGDAGVNDIISDAQAEIARVTSYFDGLTPNGSVDLDSDKLNNAKFFTDQKLGVDGVAVFDVDSQFFSRKNGIASFSDYLKNAGNLFLIRDDNTEITLSSGFNLDAGSEFGSDLFRSRIVWYFPNAKTVNLRSGLGGSLIAPLANINFSSNITGTVVGNNIHLGAEIHLPSLMLPPLPTPPSLAAPQSVPEPMSIASFGLILCGALAERRRRRRM